MAPLDPIGNGRTRTLPLPLTLPSALSLRIEVHVHVHVHATIRNGCRFDRCIHSLLRLAIRHRSYHMYGCMGLSRAHSGSGSRRHVAMHRAKIIMATMAVVALACAEADLHLHLPLPLQQQDYYN